MFKKFCGFILLIAMIFSVTTMGFACLADGNLDNAAAFVKYTRATS
jgi:hypothetical protein